MRSGPACALVLIALAAGACGGQPGSSARPAATATAVASPPAATSPQSPPGGAPGQLDRCHTSGLALAPLGPPGAAAGNLVQGFGLTNRSGTACWVYGYVGMALLDGAGGELPTRVVRDQGSRFPFAHVARYTVRPGETAPFWVHWGQVPVGAETTCPASAGLLLTPPDETTQLRLDGIQIMACNGGELDVSPVTAPGTKGF
jgi:hypothetical protein